MVRQLQYILGIDGGGTSTVAVIASTEGVILAQSKSGPSNPNTTNRIALKETFVYLFTDLRAKVSKDVWGQIVHVFAGISGAEHDDMKKVIYDILHDLYEDKSRITVDNDAITALYAGTGGEHGIVQIAGTGSISFGVDSEGNRGRVGGWGHFISENSSGYYIGKCGLAAAFDGYDGAKSETLLVEKFVRHFQVEMLPEIVPHIYRATNPKQNIADLARLVFTAASEGDIIATSILKRTGRNIGESVIALSKKLFSEKERKAGLQVIMVGSIFKQFHWLEAGLNEAIQHLNYPLVFKQVDCEPVVGAVICGMKQANISMPKTFLETIKKSIYTKEG